MDLPRLLLLTDRSQLRLGRSLVRTVAECVEAGATHVVLRELDEPEEARAALAAALVGVGATVIAAHTPLPGATGLHLPAVGQAAPASCVPASNWLRARKQPVACPQATEAAWGRSCHSPESVRAAAEEGAAWATLSPYAASDSKRGYGPPLPPTAFEDHPIPVFALGGITPANAAEARRAGAHGVAVMGAVMRAQDPAEVVRALLEELR
ncbi:MAG TPA: thiamine phosphate synthase [Nocardioides sp.]|nr:thiamine phosphate synthase [Nocardioides sp.]